MGDEAKSKLNRVRMREIIVLDTTGTRTLYATNSSWLLGNSRGADLDLIYPHVRCAVE